MSKTWQKAGLGGLVLAAVAAAGAWMWLHSSLPANGTVAAKGLGSAVAVYRDTRGIPHIFAAGEMDAYFALGYVHAQDRLWQMDSMRRFGAGKLAEILGARALRSDKFMRTLGLERLAREQFNGLPPETRGALESYALGINAWRQYHSGALPPEFLLLRYTPEPWRAQDSLLWGKIMALRLSRNWRGELLRLGLLGTLTIRQLKDMWPLEGPGDLRAGESAKQAHALPHVSPKAALGLAAIAPWPVTLPNGASNAWVVGGRRTRSGKPILANDPHLGFTAPIIWYLARIVTPELQISGVTVPGVPFTILGHNQHVAWAMTSGQADVQDVFLEKLDPAAGNRYLAPGGTMAFETRREIIQVRDSEPVSLVVRKTRHGPVVSDLGAPWAGAGAGTVMALSATNLQPGDRTSQAIHEVNRATGWEAFKKGLSNFHAPVQNFLFADVDGNIGFHMAGRIPIRRGGDGWLPAPGWDGKNDWTGEVPFTALPQAFNPPSGMFINANNRIVGDSYPYFLSNKWEPSYRADRIRELLTSPEPQTMAGTAAIQADTLSLMARSLLPRLLAFGPKTARQEKVFRLLGQWRGHMTRTRSEPLIFSAWLRELNRALYADELGPRFRRFWTLRPRFVGRILSQRQEWCDIVDSAPVEDCESVSLSALDTALDGLESKFGADMAKWRWGAAHKAAFRSPVLANIPFIGAQASLEVETDGGNYTVNRGASHINDGKSPFAHIHGPGFRAIYDLSDLNNSRFMTATGQSGNPLSPHYADNLEDWRNNKYVTLATPRRELEKKAVSVLRLVPR